MEAMDIVVDSIDSIGFIYLFELVAALAVHLVVWNSIGQSLLIN